MKFFRYAISFGLLLFYTSQVWAQPNSRQAIDSLLQASKTETDPKARLGFAMNAVKSQASYSVDSAILWLDSLTEHYKQQSFPFGEARSLSLKSWYVCFKGRYEEAMLLAHQALKIQETIEDSTGMALTIMRLGLANLQYNQPGKAEAYFLQALDVFLRSADTMRIDLIYNNLGVLYSQQGQHYKSIESYKQSLALRRKIPNYDYWEAYSLYNIAYSYLRIKDLDSAGHYFRSAEKIFLERTEGKKVPSMVELGFADYYYALGDVETAITYAQNAMKKLEGKQNMELKQEGELLLAKARYKNGDYKEAYDRLMQHQKLKSETDSLNSIERIAEVNAKYETAKKEQQLTALEAELVQQELEAKRTQTTLLWVAISAVLVVVALVLWFLKRQESQKLHAAQLEAGLAEVHLIALRAQMNPHFVFNCINTAQNFVLNANREGAYNYLSKFAKLLRSVLANSGKTYVSIEDELQQMQWYIELEQARFSEKFDFELTIDPALENGVFEIPGMVLQPFVENAIIHGLVNQRSGQKGHLQIDLKLSDELVLATIKDNGVGRKKAAEIKAQKATHYQSSAIPNVEERFRLLRTATEKEIKFTISDLEIDGQAAGTQVVLELPYR